MSAAPQGSLDTLLEYLRDVRGFDFTGYKRPSLERRIGRRLKQVGIDTYEAYVDHLALHPDEFAALFDTLLINVTGFFRDDTTWEYVEQGVVPDIVRSKGPAAPVRIWSAGCASGEEAYTLAMVLAEALGLDEFRERVKIYATDVDEDALARARVATYTERDVATVPAPYRDKYFEKLPDGGYSFSKELRRSMIFGRHDIIQDAPISRVDLLACRNVLIYVNAETQAAVLNRFNFALNDDGYLFLGKAEMLLTHGSMFQPSDLRRRVFRKAPGTRGRHVVPTRRLGENVVGNADALQRLVFEAAGLAQVVLDDGGRLALVNERAASMFDLTGRDVGRPFQDLDLSYRPVDLRTAVGEVHDDRRPVRLKEVEWNRAGGERLFLDVHVVPLHDGDRSLAGVAITFADVTRQQELNVELEHANIELETAYEELQSTNEELETTNEELQSTVEELETTNEELQSTNEELETMNEELQSTNDELQSINDQLRDRTAETNRLNAFLQAIVSSLDGAVAVLDDELRVRLWSSQAIELWGLRADEVTGQAFSALDIGLPVAEVAQPIRRVVEQGADAESVDVVGHDRRGRPVNLRVSVTALRAAGTGGFDGAILFAQPVGS